MAISLTPVGTIVGSLSPVETITAELNIPTYINVDVYDGEYEFAPTTETQVINTANKTLTNNIVINPIPSNYGRITWDGGRLTIS